MDERRLYKRYLLDTKIDHKAVQSKETGLSQAKDISRGGICITTEGEPLKLEAQYRISFFLPEGDQEIKAVARVLWHRRDGTLYDNGLAFSLIDDRCLRLIEDYAIGSVDEKA